MSSKRKKDRGDRNEIKVAAVLEERDRMITRATAARAADVWAKPYDPPAEGTVRNLCTKLGPPAALNELRNRERAHNAKRFDDERRSNAADQANRRRLQAVDDEIAAERRSRTLGQRLDDALAKAATVSDSPAAVMDANRVSGSIAAQGGPRPVDSIYDHGLREARRLVELLELDVDRSTRRTA